MAQNVYMPRLRDRSVLATCIRDGVQSGTFGYASAFEGEYYRNFRFEEQIGGLRVVEGSAAVLINPEMAKLLKEEKEKQQKSDPPESAPDPEKQTGDDSTGRCGRTATSTGTYPCRCYQSLAVRITLHGRNRNLTGRNRSHPPSRWRKRENRNHRYCQQIRRLFRKHHPCRQAKQRTPQREFKSD